MAFKHHLGAFVYSGVSTRECEKGIASGKLMFSDPDTDSKESYEVEPTEEEN